MATQQPTAVKGNQQLRSGRNLNQAEILFRLTSRQADGPSIELRNTQRVKTQPRVDFSLENRGSVFLLRPITAQAFEWVEAHVGLNGFQLYRPNIVVEHRYVEAVLNVIQADSLEVA